LGPQFGYTSTYAFLQNDREGHSAADKYQTGKFAPGAYAALKYKVALSGTRHHLDFALGIHTWRLGDMAELSGGLHTPNQGGSGWLWMPEIMIRHTFSFRPKDQTEKKIEKMLKRRNRGGTNDEEN